MTQIEDENRDAEQASYFQLLQKMQNEVEFVPGNCFNLPY